ncbi:hypothetical protein PMAYCL1PPCAC_09791, partial [Pristionchus mayeri]
MAAIINLSKYKIRPDCTSVFSGETKMNPLVTLVRYSLVALIVVWAMSWNKVGRIPRKWKLLFT